MEYSIEALICLERWYEIYSIYKTLEKLKCKTCGNLTYWDGFYCKIGKHHKKDDKLSRIPLKECDGYIKRKGSNWKSCEGQECVFWCRECPAYGNRDE